MGKYLDMIRVAERQKAERGTFVASVASVATPNSHLATTEQPQIDDLQAHLLGDKSDKSDKSPPWSDEAVPFSRLCRFGRSPETQVTEDSWTDAQEERAATVEYDGGAPRDWAEALARLDPDKPPRHVPPKRWVRFIDDCGRFLDCGWADKAAALGWGPLHLFGCDRKRPYYVPPRGLLWEVNGGTIVALSHDLAIIEIEGGDRRAYKREPVEFGPVIPAWELTP